MEAVAKQTTNKQKLENRTTEPGSLAPAGTGEVKGLWRGVEGRGSLEERNIE